MLSVVSLIAIALIIGAIALGWSKKFLAVGALAVANVIIHGFTALGPRQLATCTGHNAYSPVIHQELGLCAGDLYAGNPMVIVQFFTSMFVHADFMHLFGNLIILLAFALVFEELIGPRKFLLLYLGTGLIAAGGQLLANFGQPMLLVGASGAVFGIIGSFAGSYPQMVMRLPIPLPIIIFVKMRVLTAALLFGLAQVVFTFLSSATAGMGNVAYAAHLAGLLAGFVLAVLIVRRGRPEPGKPVVTPIKLEQLEQFALDASTRRAYAEMQANRDEPDVFKAWFDRFWQGARDPETNQRVHPGPRGKLVREDGQVIELP